MPTNTGEPVEPIVDLLAEEWVAIAALGAELRPEEWTLLTECPGWTVRDVLAHMVGTELTLLGTQAPPVPDPMPDHVHNPIGAGNEAWVAARRPLPAEDVLTEFRDVTERRLAALRSMGPDDFGRPGPSPVGVVPYREFMSVRLMDCWVHEQDMRVASGRRGHAGGPVAQAALDRIASAMPFVVGKKASAPEGARVRFAITGAAPRRLDVLVVDGRARAEPEDGPATAQVTCDAEVFWRLGCGRLAGPAARRGGDVALAGDAELACRVVDSMAFMI